jgi:FtsP/CotA-like multicopper oxidase with cupredoxin domain
MLNVISIVVLVSILLITSSISIIPSGSKLLIGSALADSTTNNSSNGADLTNDIISKPISVGQYDKIKNCTTNLSKKPTSIEYLTHFNCGRVSQGENGQTVREFTLIVQENQNISISHDGHYFDAWAFNGTVPGPTMRVTEGDLVRVNVVNSKDSQNAHSIHMHSIHGAEMDGVANPIPADISSSTGINNNNHHGSFGHTENNNNVYASGLIPPGKSFTYEFVAQPYGVYPYHCHVNPVADHINRGLYGMMIIDPKQPREERIEMAMTMNGYDMDYDLEGPVAPPSMAAIKGEEEREEEEERDNEIYTVNGKAFDYMENPIQLNVGEKYRIYLLNMVEFDLINSFHLHGDMYSYIPGGTDHEGSQINDVVELGQANRGIIEFQYHNPGRYMFHAHVQEFTDLGWMGLFDVKQ